MISSFNIEALALEHVDCEGTAPQREYLEVVKSDMTFCHIAIPYIRKD